MLCSAGYRLVLIAHSTWLVLPEFTPLRSAPIASVCAAENLYAIETLKDFSYNEDGRDIGVNVREKVKALVALLRDDDKLRNERVKASKARACALARPSDAAAAHVRCTSTLPLLGTRLNSRYCR